MDHRIQGMIIFPGAAMLTMVLEACKQMATQLEAIQGYQFQDVNFYRPIVFASPAAVAETVLQFRPHNLGTRASGTAHWAHFNILTIGVDNSAIEHCSGLVKTIYITNPNEIDNGIEATQEWDTYRQEYLSILERPTKEQYVDHLYNKLNNLGLQFGPLFRNITQIHTGDGFGYAELQIPDTAARMPENFEYSVPIHPAVLDGVFQMMICCGTVKDDSPAVAPSFIESLYISASLPPTGSRMTGFSTLNPKVRLQQSGNVIVSNNSWTEPKILLKGFVCTELTSTHSRPPRKICTHLEWKMDVVSSHITTKKLLNTQHLSLDPALARSSSLWDQAASRFIQKSLALLSDEATNR
jgi:acyl transferase domain-containing protein